MNKRTKLQTVQSLLRIASSLILAGDKPEPKNAEDFHEHKKFSPPEGWSVQKWNMKDQCCGGGVSSIILPNDWNTKVSKAIQQGKDLADKLNKELEATDPDFKFKGMKKGEDGNSHLGYIDTDLMGSSKTSVLMQGIIKLSDDFTTMMCLAIRPNGDYAYYVFADEGEVERKFSTLPRATDFFKQLSAARLKKYKKKAR